MKIVLYMHTGSGNHGCEAIARTTSSLLGGPENTVLWTFAKHEDETNGVSNKFEKIVASEEIKRFSPSHLEAFFRRKILHQKDANMKVFLRKEFKGNIAVSVGGDNYCYPWSAKQNTELNREIRKCAKATVLWGCSIDPEAITPEIQEDLARYDLITAREPLTYQLLKPINPHTVRVADPAFTLEREDLSLPDGFEEGNTVGVNVSPLIFKYGKEGTLIHKNYVNLIRAIIDRTNMQVCLIPHVMWEGNNDLEPIQMLYEEFRSSGRVCIITEGNALQLKGYIARCRFFVGARTHATIAAYSTCVPTLAVGYSVKSRGIAMDLFGTEKNYVLSVQDLESENELSEAFDWIIQHEEEIRQHLQKTMPEYLEKAKCGVEMLSTLIR